MVKYSFHGSNKLGDVLVPTRSIENFERQHDIKMLTSFPWSHDENRIRYIFRHTFSFLEKPNKIRIGASLCVLVLKFGRERSIRGCNSSLFSALFSEIYDCLILSLVSTN